MKSSLLYTRKIIPEYVIVSLALLQSEIFWICSVVYHVLISRLPNQPPVTPPAINDDSMRHRAGSAPPVLMTNPAEKKKKTVTYSKSVTDSVKKNASKRRSSLGDLDTMPLLRVRPSIHDERTGTTCPPIWWQKTRVKLRRPPTHARTAASMRPKLSTSTSTSTFRSTSSSSSSVETLNNVSSSNYESVTVLKESGRSELEITTNTTANAVPSILRPSKSLTSLHTMFTSSRNNVSTYTINEEMAFPQERLRKSLSDEPQQQQERRERRKFKKFINKLNTSLRPRQQPKDNDSRSLVTAAVN